MKNLTGARLYHWHAVSSKPDWDGKAEVGGYLPWGYAQQMLITHIHELSERFPKSAGNCAEISMQIAIAAPGARTWELYLVEVDATVTFTTARENREKLAAPKPAGNTAPPAVRPRIGDADRQKVLDKLEQAYSGGYLTQEEWSERADQVIAARYADELPAITADLTQVKEEKEEKEESIVPAMRAAGEVDGRMLARASAAFVVIMFAVVFMVASIVSAAPFVAHSLGGIAIVMMIISGVLVISRRR